MRGTDTGIAGGVAAGALGAQATDLPIAGSVPSSLEELVPWVVVTVTLYVLGLVGEGVKAALADWREARRVARAGNVSTVPPNPGK